MQFFHAYFYLNKFIDLEPSDMQGCVFVALKISALVFTFYINDMSR